MTDQEQELISEIVRSVTEHPVIKRLKEWATRTGAPRHPDIAGAIYSVMGVTFREIKTDTRKRWHVYARMIYAHHCKERGENAGVIADETHHDLSTIHYYLRRYQQERKYNREFRTPAEKVEEVLNQQPQKAND